MVRVLFVCTGNICRSPTAEGVFRHVVADAGFSRRILSDSAGTHGYHVGDQPDSRAQRAALRRGFDLSDLRARRIGTGDFLEFDYILAMDRGHLHQLERLAPPHGGAELRLFLDYAPGLKGREVPDPYYGGPEDFETVLDLVEEGASGLLAHIRKTRLPA
jgi:protein-tyrosine phosphatase